jgi:hypothetical protein
LRALLLGHVVPLTWYSVGFQDGQSVKALNGNKIPVAVASDGEHFYMMLSGIDYSTYT